jgi:hypothetical protein
MSDGEAFEHRWSIEIERGDDGTVRTTLWRVESVNEDGGTILHEVETCDAPTIMGALTDCARLIRDEDRQPPRDKHAYKRDVAPDGRKKGTAEVARWREKNREHFRVYNRERMRRLRERKGSEDAARPAEGHEAVRTGGDTPT